MNIIFVADVFADQIPGGGEIVNDLVCQALEENGHHVQKVLSQNINKEDVAHAIQNGFHFIFGNHLQVDPEIKHLFASGSIAGQCKYIIYEHDHKYLLSRDPSVYDRFVAPSKGHIVDEQFYLYASAVLCQSKIHKEVLLKNIPETKAVNLGCSIWSDDFIAAVEDITINKSKGTAIIKSSNPTKNQQKAEIYCQSEGIEYDLVSSDSPVGLLNVLAEYEQYVFFPRVLETFCRVVVEAKLAGCKIITNPKLLGVASEEWFVNSTREQILQKIKSSKQNTIETIENIFSTKASKINDITVILNSYRRPYNLERQIEAIREQSVEPKEIWLWINDHEDNRGFDHTKLDVDRIFHNNHNWKFYGRFAAALLADTEHVAIFDDDTIPGSKWFENCLDSMQQQEGIMGSAGYIQTGPYAMQYEPERAGWPAKNDDLKRVDYVGHAWFFKRSWLSYLWAEKPFTWDNGEDIHFSYTAQKYGGIQTYCPPHPEGDLSMHGSLHGYELGVDDKATSNNIAVSHQVFFTQRDGCIQTAIKGGWETVYNVKVK